MDIPRRDVDLTFDPMTVPRDWCGGDPFLTKPGAWTSLVRAAVTHVMGKEPELNAGGGTSDARFIAKYCPVVESGMTSKTIHHVDEYCTLEDLEKCELIYLEILKRYFA